MARFRFERVPTARGGGALTAGLVLDDLSQQQRNGAMVAVDAREQRIFGRDRLVGHVRVADQRRRPGVTGLTRVEVVSLERGVAPGWGVR